MVAAAAEVHIDDGSRRGLGIVLICTILMRYLPGIGKNIIPIVLASVLTCGCCKPRVEIWAKATLVTLCLMSIIQTIINKAVAALLRDVSKEGITILIPRGFDMFDIIAFVLAYVTCDR